MQRYKMAGGVTTRAVIFLSLIVFSGARHYPDFSYALRRLQSRNTWEHLFDGDWSTLFDQQWLQSIAVNSTAHHRLESAINSPDCVYDLVTFAMSLRRMEMWAIESKWKLWSNRGSPPQRIEITNYRNNN